MFQQSSRIRPGVKHRSDALEDTIEKSAHDNYVGPWFSSFLKRRGL